MNSLVEEKNGSFLETTQLFSFVEKESTSHSSSASSPTGDAIKMLTTSCSCKMDPDDYDGYTWSQICSWDIDNLFQLVSIGLSCFSIAWAISRSEIGTVETSGKKKSPEIITKVTDVEIELKEVDGTVSDLTNKVNDVDSRMLDGAVSDLTSMDNNVDSRMLYGAISDQTNKVNDVDSRTLDGAVSDLTNKVNDVDSRMLDGAVSDLTNKVNDVDCRMLDGAVSDLTSKDNDVDSRTLDGAISNQTNKVNDVDSRTLDGAVSDLTNKVNDVDSRMLDGAISDLTNKVNDDDSITLDGAAMKSKYSNKIDKIDQIKTKKPELKCTKCNLIFSTCVSLFQKHKQLLVKMFSFFNTVIGVLIIVYVIFNLMLTKTIVFALFVPLILFRAATPDMLKAIWRRGKQTYSKKYPQIAEDVHTEQVDEVDTNGVRCDVDDVKKGCYSFVITKQTAHEKRKNKSKSPKCQRKVQFNGVWRTMFLCFPAIFLHIILSFEIARSDLEKVVYTVFHSPINKLFSVDDFSPSIFIEYESSNLSMSSIQSNPSLSYEHNGWQMKNGQWVRLPTELFRYHGNKKTRELFEQESFNRTFLVRRTHRLCFNGWIDRVKWKQIISHVYGDFDFYQEVSLH